jgi:hypothetical protein
LTSEQLQNARAERWRQVSNPVLTAEDARAWLEGIGFCLFLPRKSSGLAFAPAPSFVEAVAGGGASGASEAPAYGTVARDAGETATGLLHRLAADGVVVPLNLSAAAGAFAGNHSGAAGGGASDAPDFVATREALPYVFSLIGGRNWKSGPGAKASPLMVEIWKQLEGAGAQTAQEIQTALGREVTEGAVLRGLMELWNGLRAIPAYDGDATRWELTQARFAAEMTASQKVAQATALSALVSLYLEAVVAASSEEIETFLSPLAGRSRVREVVNGLAATRQLELVSVGAQPLFHVAGMLPEFAEAEPVKAQGERPAGFEKRRAVEPRAGLERRGAFGKRPPFEKRGGGFERRPREEGAARKGFARRKSPQEGGAGPARGGPGREGPARGTERPYRRPFDQERGAEGRGPRFEGGERGAFGKKPPEKAGRPFEPRRFDRPKSGGERPGGERRSGSGGNFAAKRFGKGGESRPGRFSGARKFSGGGKSGAGKFGAVKKFGGPKRFGERGSSGGFEPEKPGGKRPFFRERGTEGRERGTEGDSRGRGFGAGRDARSGGWKAKTAGGFPKQGKPEFRKAGERGAGRARPGFEGKKSGEREEGVYRREGRPQFKSGDKPGFGKKRFGERGAGKPGFKKSGFGESTKPFGKPGNRPPEKPFGKSGSRSGKTFGKSAKPFGKSGKPAFGRGKPGGFKPPFRKRKDGESGTGE